MLKLPTMMKASLNQICQKLKYKHLDNFLKKVLASYQKTSYQKLKVILTI
jgi:hypothetical protein